MRALSCFIKGDAMGHHLFKLVKGMDFGSA